MDQKRICFFTYADGDWVYMAQTMVSSMRECGVSSDIICFGDKPILGATHTHYRKLTAEQKNLYFFKLDLLATFSHATEYDYLVWLDADCLFIRPLPDDFLSPMKISPLHGHLTWNFNIQPDFWWWGRTAGEIMATYRKYGVTTDEIYAMNGGYWIVERKFISAMYDMIQYFRAAEPDNNTLVDEVVIAWVLHLVTGNLGTHIGTNKRSDFALYEFAVDRLPLPDKIIGSAHPGLDAYMQIDPAIVHLIHGKSAMIEAGRVLLSKKLLE
jgi:hypothetical protein